MASIKKFVDSVKVVDGVGSKPFTTIGNIVGVYVMPPGADSYGFGIVDEGGFIIYSKLDHTGHLADQPEIVVYPGEKIITIQQAEDGDYRVKLIFRE